MDLFAFNLTDLPAALIGDVPDFAWAAMASAVATLGLAIGFGPRRAARAQPRTEKAPAAVCDFLIHGATVQPLTDPARILLDGLGPTLVGVAALRHHLEADCPSIEADLEKLILYGAAFRHHLQRADGAAFSILGEPRGAAAYLSIRPASAEARALRDAEQAALRAQAEARFLREAFDRAPVLAWSLAADRTVSWANAAYRDRFAPPQGDLPDHRIPDAFGHVLDEVPLTAPSGNSRRRVAVPAAPDDEAHWFEVSQSPGPGGETLGFALDADELMAAEASLRRFIETLTETFAHLPIGLAVFDKNRRLGLFNPALTDLVKIDAVWLAGRPSLRDFLERLRETRQMPEQRDFAAWRRKLTEIEEGAREGAYEENWVLPSGKVFRVTGRPHPQGALAFLFEDISTAIQLERRYRAELEQSQATLDRMAEAVAVFDTSGMLVFVNSAFEAMWGLDPMEGLAGPGVADLTALWSAQCRPSPVWERLRAFATGAETRATWVDAVETRDGRVLQMLVAPLPDASALAVFRNLTEERLALAGARDSLAARREAREQDALLEDLAQAQIELPVETAMSRMAAIPAGGSTETLQALKAAAQGLKDGLAQSRALREIARTTPEGRGPAAGLTALLAARGLTLDLAGETAADAPGRRRALWALALAAADLAAPGAAVAMTATEEPEGFALTARLSAVAAGPTEGVSLALARWIVASLGGGLALEPDPGRGEITLRVTLPLTFEARPAAALTLRAC